MSICSTMTHPEDDEATEVPAAGGGCTRDSTEPAIATPKGSLMEVGVNDGFWEQFLRDDDDGVREPADRTMRRVEVRRHEDSRVPDDGLIQSGTTEPAVPKGSSMEDDVGAATVGVRVDDGFWEQFFRDDDDMPADPTADYTALLEDLRRFAQDGAAGEEAPAASDDDNDQLLNLTLLTTSSPCPRQFLDGSLLAPLTHCATLKAGNVDVQHAADAELI